MIFKYYFFAFLILAGSITITILVGLDIPYLILKLFMEG